MCLAPLQVYFGLRNEQGSPDASLAIARCLAATAFAAVAGAYLALSWAFFDHDFSLAYVAAHSNLALPLGYRMAAVWGGYEGALLLWLLALQAWIFAWTRYGGTFPAVIESRTNAVLALVNIGGLFALLTSADLFRRSTWVPADGADLSPLLQDPAMALHPPLLIIAYAGACVPFAVVGAQLVCGRFERRWFGALRPWVITTWLFLTLGILLGSWWSYYELGWGGWWSWDPINSVAFMPWLVLTALVHSLMVTERRGACPGWSVALVISVFILSLVGALSIRSGILSSVHNFSEKIDHSVLAFIYFSVLVGGIAFLAFRGRASMGAALRRGQVSPCHSTDKIVLINNVLLSVTTALIFIGTFAPVVMRSFGVGPVSIGRPYFDGVIVGLMLPAVAVAGLAIPVFGSGASESTRVGLRVALLAVLVFGIGWIGLSRGYDSVPTAAGIVVAIWLAVSSVLAGVATMRNGPARPSWRKSGVIVAHLGLSLFVLGATVVTSFGEQMTVRLAPGKTVFFRHFLFRFDDQDDVDGVNYSALRASISLWDGNGQPELLYPERRAYGDTVSTVSEVSISSNWRRDIFVALGNNLGGDSWSVTLKYSPLMRLIWIGGLAIFFGGALALMGRVRLNVRGAERLPVDGRFLKIGLVPNRHFPAIAALALAIVASGMSSVIDRQRRGVRLFDTAPLFLTDGAMFVAQTHLAEHRYVAARQAFTEVLTINPHDSWAKLGFVQASLAVDHRALTGAAGQLIEEVLVDLPDDPAALWYGAKAAQGKGDSQLAYKRWNRLLSLSPPPMLRMAITEQLASIRQQGQRE